MATVTGVAAGRSPSLRRELPIRRAAERAKPGPGPPAAGRPPRPPELCTQVTQRRPPPVPAMSAGNAPGSGLLLASRRQISHLRTLLRTEKKGTVTMSGRSPHSGRRRSGLHRPARAAARSASLQCSPPCSSACSAAGDGADCQRTAPVMSVRAALTQGRSALRVLTADTALLPGCPAAVCFLPACPWRRRAEESEPMNSEVFLLLREPSYRLRWLGCSARPPS
jgi:hypothetical protein